MKIGDRIFVRGYIDEIRKDTVIVRNDGGYFGTILSEVTGELPSAQQETHEKRTETHACDCISREAAIDAVSRGCQEFRGIFAECEKNLNALPSAQPDYKEVLGWLLAYHTISFDLHGRYLPHEVISWIINDFTREFIAVKEQDE